MVDESNIADATKMDDVRVSLDFENDEEDEFAEDHYLEKFLIPPTDGSSSLPYQDHIGAMRNLHKAWEEELKNLNTQYQELIIESNRISEEKLEIMKNRNEEDVKRAVEVALESQEQLDQMEKEKNETLEQYNEQVLKNEELVAQINTKLTHMEREKNETLEQYNELVSENKELAAQINMMNDETMKAIEEKTIIINTFQSQSKHKDIRATAELKGRDSRIKELEQKLHETTSSMNAREEDYNLQISELKNRFEIEKKKLRKDYEDQAAVIEKQNEKSIQSVEAAFSFKLQSLSEKHKTELEEKIKEVVLREGTILKKIKDENEKNLRKQIEKYQEEILQLSVQVKKNEESFDQRFKSILSERDECKDELQNYMTNSENKIRQVEVDAMQRVSELRNEIQVYKSKYEKIRVGHCKIIARVRKEADVEYRNMIRTMKHKLENDLKDSNALMENVLQQQLGSLQRKKEMNMSETELSTSEVDGFAAAIENELKKVTQQIESDTKQFLVESDGGRLSIDSAASERRQFSTPQNDDIDHQQEPEDRFREQQLEYDSKILELVSSVNKQNHTPKSLSKENEEIEQDIDMCKLKVAKEILEKDLEHAKLVIERQSTFIEAVVQNSHLSVDMYHGCTPEELLDNLRVDLCQLNGSYPNGAISNLVNDSDQHLPRISSLDQEEKMEMFDRDKEGSEVMNGVSQYIESNASASELSSSVVANGVSSKSEENVETSIHDDNLVDIDNHYGMNDKDMEMNEKKMVMDDNDEGTDDNNLEMYDENMEMNKSNTEMDDDFDFQNDHGDSDNGFTQEPLATINTEAIVEHNDTALDEGGNIELMETEKEELNVINEECQNSIDDDAPGERCQDPLLDEPEQTQILPNRTEMGSSYVERHNQRLTTIETNSEVIEEIRKSDTSVQKKGLLSIDTEFRCEVKAPFKEYKQKKELLENDDIHSEDTEVIENLSKRSNKIRSKKPKSPEKTKRNVRSKIESKIPRSSAEPSHSLSRPTASFSRKKKISGIKPPSPLSPLRHKISDKQPPRKPNRSPSSPQKENTISANNSPRKTTKTKNANKGRSKVISSNSYSSTYNADPKNMRIVFCVPLTNDHKLALKFFGITLITNIEDAASATHVVGGGTESGIRRTSMFMISLCCTSNIVHVNWLTESLRRRTLLPFNHYLLLNDEASETKYAFTLKQTLRNGVQRRREGGLLSKWSVYFCKDVAGNKAPKEDELYHIIHAAGGVVIDTHEPFKKPYDKEHVLVITSDPPLDSQTYDINGSKLSNEGAGMFTTSWLFDCIMHQSLTGIRRGLGR